MREKEKILGPELNENPLCQNLSNTVNLVQKNV